MSLFEYSQDGFTVGGDIDKVTVSVHVSSDTLDPDVVSKLLGVEPSFTARKGEERSSKGGKRVVQRTGVWWVQVGDTREWLLEDAINALFGRLPSDLAVWRELARNYELRLSCGLHIEDWNRGCELSPALLLRIAERGLTLDFDIYCSVEDQDGDV